MWLTFFLFNFQEFEKVQEQVQLLRAKQELPFEVDDDYKSFLGKIGNMVSVVTLLTSLTNTQTFVVSPPALPIVGSPDL